MTFEALGLRDELVAALAERGITDPFPIQELTVRDSLAGRDVCGKAKTGSGKTLAFGLPVLERTQPGARPKRPRALILAPTRELAGQIVDVLKPLAAAVGLRVAAVYGGTPIDRQITMLRKGGVEVIVATPGRLIDLLERNVVRLPDVKTVVVDEADRMADMGFLPQVEWVMRHLEGNNPQVLLFSATLDGDVDILVRHYLNDPVRHEVEEEADAIDNIAHRFFLVHQMDRVRVVAAIARGANRAIAFTRTKRGADRLAAQLQDEGVTAAAIHGDLRQAARERALKRFGEGKLDVLVATDVAARGVHVDDVEAVIHFDVPEDTKAYVHRSGRTGRAGKTGAVATLVMWNQMADTDRMKRQLGVEEPTIEVFSNDPRLADLASFEVTEEEAAKATGTDGAKVTAPVARPGGRPTGRRGGSLGRGGRGRGRR